MLPKCIASCMFSEVILVLFSNCNSVILKVIFKVRKVKFGPLLYMYANISETVHSVTKVCMKHIYKVIYDLSVYLVTSYL